MTSWTKQELAAIAGDESLYIAVPNADGTMHAPTRIWAVEADGELYARSYNGVGGRWYQAAQIAKRGHITSGGVEKDVTFEFPDDDATHAAIDRGYETKYAGSPYTPPMLSEQARAATVQLIPIENQKGWL